MSDHANDALNEALDPITPEEYEITDAIDSDILDGVEPVEDEFQEGESEEQSSHTYEENRPIITDAEWTDWVLSKMTPKEKDEKGRPFVHGLRRVGSLLIGPVIENISEPVQCPLLLTPETARFHQAPPGATEAATVKHRLTVIWCDGSFGDEFLGTKVTVQDCADTYFGNSEHPFFVHASAVAATKAEGRAWKKLMQLKTLTAEEMQTVPELGSATNGMILREQINVMERLCRELDIDIMEFISKGRGKYKDIQNVPYGVAEKMISHLSDVDNDRAQLAYPNPQTYKADWRK